MKFGTLIVLGSILAVCAPAALAAPILTGEIDLAGIGNVNNTSFNLNNPKPGNPNKGAPQGTIAGTAAATLTTPASIAPTGGFKDFTAGTAFLYSVFPTPPAPNKTNFPFATATPATPVDFFSITEGSDTLTFYITNVNLASVVTGKDAKTSGQNQHGATPGSFSGTGYVTDTGFGQTNVKFTISTGPGASSEDFILSIVAAPEPSSFALLGTGFLGLVGVGRRKLFKA